MLDFAQWLNNFAPVDPRPSGSTILKIVLLVVAICVDGMLFANLSLFGGRLSYATSFDGPTYCRPWMLHWRCDYGLSGYLEPEQASMIMEAIFAEGFLAII